MVERILEQLPAIEKALEGDEKGLKLVPKWQGKGVLESINAALKPVADFTDALSSEKTVTASSVKPVLQLLTGDLLLSSSEEEETELTRNLKKKMSDVLTQKYNDPAIQQLLAKAAFVDPRYRDSIPVEELKDVLLEEMLALPEETEMRDDDGARPSTSASVEDEGASESAPPPAKKRNLADLLSKRKGQTSSAPVPKRIRADTELTRYLQEETLDSHDDPLIWWKENQGRFPLLSKVARKYLTVCATSTASERVFSAAGNVVTPMRSSLKPDKVNMLVFLARNLKSER